MRRNLYNAFEIKLNENNPTDIGIETVQLLRAGRFAHPSAPGGEFEITPATLRVMKANFDENVRRLNGQQLAVDYSHRSDGKASGWIKSIELRENDTEMWVNIDWTPNAAQAITEKEYRYISADIDFGYRDNESRINHGAVLMGAGLTNRPHIKDMEIILNEQQFTGVEEMDFEQLLAAIKGLSDEEKAKVMSMLSAVSKSQMEEKEKMLEEKEATLSDSNKELEEAKAELSEVKTKLEESDKKVVELSEKVETQEKEASFKVLLEEGKVTPSQKEAFMEMELKLSEKFFANAETKVNLSEKGHGETPATKEGQSEDETSAYDEISKLAVELSEKDSINFEDAISIVLSENKELSDKYYNEIETGE